MIPRRFNHVLPNFPYGYGALEHSDVRAAVTLQRGLKINRDYKSVRCFSSDGDKKDPPSISQFKRKLVKSWKDWDLMFYMPVFLCSVFIGLVLSDIASAVQRDKTSRMQIETEQKRRRAECEESQRAEDEHVVFHREIAEDEYVVVRKDGRRIILILAKEDSSMIPRRFKHVLPNFPYGYGALEHRSCPLFGYKRVRCLWTGSCKQDQELGISHAQRELDKTVKRIHFSLNTLIVALFLLTVLFCYDWYRSCPMFGYKSVRSMCSGGSKQDSQEQGISHSRKLELDKSEEQINLQDRDSVELKINIIEKKLARQNGKLNKSDKRFSSSFNKLIVAGVLIWWCVDLLFYYDSYRVVEEHVVFRRVNRKIPRRKTRISSSVISRRFKHVLLADADASVNSRRFKHVLPDLPYDYGALEPVISAEITRLHHQKHHATYVNNLNVAEEKCHEALQKGDVRAAITLLGALNLNGGYKTVRCFSSDGDKQDPPSISPSKRELDKSKKDLNSSVNRVTSFITIRP
ncbi:iron/manganese superoxide dismutase, alpha-hairpin domain-containing protein [Ditylenchus destructor]|nr:iron/manganese superoxide dismutase, alpha-hairpin domain-containing protein [Ditylenchus destructor]